MRYASTRSASPSQHLAGCIDVETTGLSPWTDEIIELAIILFSYDPDTGKILAIVDEYAGLREPTRPIPPDATRVHGLTDRHVQGKQLDEHRIIELMSRAQFLIAHNVGFDKPFVERLFPYASTKPWVCSMNDIPWRAEGFPSKGLQNLLRAHRIPSGRAHRGADDAHATLRLLAQRDRDGQYYLLRLIQVFQLRHEADESIS